MAPSNFDKDESDRAYISDELNFLETQLASNSATPLTRIQVKQSMDLTEDLQKTLQQNQNSMRNHATKTTDMGPHTQEYYKLRSQASRLYSGFHGIYSSFPSSTAAASGTPPLHPPSQRIKLPPLDLPKFGGNLQEWITFRDLFKTTVDAASITKVEKLSQLKSLLTGEAARQVRSLVLCDTNYDIAWSALEERYENNRELMFSIMKRLFTQPQVTTSSSVHLRGLIDTTKECLRQLEVLSPPTQHYDAIIIYLVSSKADSGTRELWEQSLPNTNIPNLKALFEFLEQRARALAAGSASHGSNHTHGTLKFDKPKVRSNYVSPPPKCKLDCNESHPIFRCPAFRNKTPQQRRDTVKQFKLCENCLSSTHQATTCGSQHTCRECQAKHHTFLHLETQSRAPPVARFNHIQPLGAIRTGILATADILIIGTSGNASRRALIDPGTTNTSITEDTVKRLNLPVRRCNIPLTGLEEKTVGVANYVTTFKFTPHFNQSLSYAVTALVVKSIGGNIPSERLRRENWPHLQGLQLADPMFEIPGTVDILLGTDIFWETLQNEKIVGSRGQPIAIRTSLGWLVVGENTSSTPIKVFHLSCNLDYTLQRFWEQESIEEDVPQTQDEKDCEDHFETTHTRDPASGRFTVRLPFKKSSYQLGSSRQLALKRFLSMERKFNGDTADPERYRKNQKQWNEYKLFMTAYEQLGHMKLIPPEHLTTSNPVYYIPHHSVLKESSSTTKLRVVFDASATTTTGYSLNDCLLSGPQLQQPMTHIMMRFRLNQIAFTADIAKMYRQIQISEEDWNYQRIFWRPNKHQQLREYWLCTVTYGTTSAPYLAVKSLQQLAKDEMQRFPRAAAIALQDFYVDDSASGCDNLDNAKQIVKELIDLALTGGFELRKWTTNSKELLDTIPEDLRETANLVELQHDNQSIKTL